MSPAATIESGIRPRKNGKPDRTLIRKGLQAFYGSLQYSVERQGFGKVSFDENALGELCNYINSDAEFAAAKAAPAVVKRGIQADHHVEHKGHSDVESYTFAAPVVLNGKRGNEAVVVQRTNRNKPHCVRILMPDGSGFDLDATERSSPNRSQGVQKNSSGQLMQTASFNSISETDENSNLRFSIKDASPVDVNELRAGNEKLRRALDLAEDQVKLTAGHKVKEGYVGTLAKRILKEYNSSFDYDTFKANLIKVFEYLSHAKNPNMAEVEEMTIGLMKRVIEKSNTFDAAGYEAYAGVRSYLRETGISLSEDQKLEAAVLSDTYGAYRASLFGSVKLTNDGLALDSAWQELSQMNPNLFPPDTNASDMPRTLLLAAKSIGKENFYKNEFAYDLDSFAADAWSYVFEAYFKSQTFADKKQAQIQELNKQMRLLRAASRKEAQAVEREIIRNATAHAKEIAKHDKREAALRDAMLMERVRKRVRPNGGMLTPPEIASLDVSDLSSTPKLAPIDASSERGGTSKFAESIERASVFSEETMELIRNEDDVRYYANITNAETLNEANNRLNSLGSSEALRWYNMPPQNATALDVAEGFILLKRYQDAGDYESAVTVVKKLRQMGTRAGQTTQAFAILGKLTPEGMAVYAQKELDDIRAELVKRFSQEWVDARAEMFQLTPEEMENICAAIEQASILPEGRDKILILSRIASVLEAKLPTNAGKVVKALARNFMLLNPKTMIRNVLGNAIMMPAYMVQDFVGAGVDRALARKTGIRTTGVTTPNRAALKAAKKGLYESFDDFRNHVNTREYSNDRFEIGSGNALKIGSGSAFRHYNKAQREAASPIKRPAMLLSNALNMMDRITGFLLDAGDRPFFEYHFTNALNNQLRLNNAAEPTAEMIEIATAEALMRTWQDDNAATEYISSLRKGANLNKEFGLGTLLVPFTKTPTNLVKALVEYSPAGLINALARKSRAYAYAVKKGSVTAQMQKDYVTALSKGITGTLIMLIAAALAAKGVLTGGDDDEDKDLAAFKKNILGVAPYSVVIDGKSYTYDWAQPVGGLMAISADFVQSMKDGKNAVKGIQLDEDDTEKSAAAAWIAKPINAIFNALAAGGNVIFEQSFLQGIQGLFSQEGVTSGMIDAALGSITQFVPTALGQVAQLADPYARTSYETGDWIGTARNKVVSKLPGARNELAPVVDVLGNDVLSNGGANNPFNVFLNPSNVYSKNATEAALEIYRVYQETGVLSVIPRVAAYRLEYDDATYEFTSHERAQYQRTMGRTNAEVVTQLLKSRSYSGLDDSDRAAALTYVTSYANAIAKEEFLLSKDVVYDFGSLSWVVKARDGQKVGLSVEDYIVAKTLSRGINSGLKDKEGETIDNSRGLLIMSAVYSNPAFAALPEKQRLYLFESLGVGKDVRHWNKALVEQELAKMRGK
jgi:hypothetical protein